MRVGTGLERTMQALERRGMVTVNGDDYQLTARGMQVRDLGKLGTNDYHKVDNHRRQDRQDSPRA